MTRKITALKIQKKNNNRVSVYLDHEYAFGLSRIVAGWLEVGQQLSEEKIMELKAKDDVEVALQKALNFLSYRPRSEKEVRQNLKIKHGIIEEDIIDLIIERLKSGGLVDDSNFAELWVENRNEFRPRGSRALRTELRQKGIDEEIIALSLKDLDEDKLALKAARKQSRKYKQLEWDQFRKKLTGFLARRGFPYGVISEVTPKVWDEICSQQPD
jgi:regulatory protein